MMYIWCNAGSSHKPELVYKPAMIARPARPCPIYQIALTAVMESLLSKSGGSRLTLSTSRPWCRQFKPAAGLHRVTIMTCWWRLSMTVHDYPWVHSSPSVQQCAAFHTVLWHHWWHCYGYHWSLDIKWYRYISSLLTSLMATLDIIGILWYHWIPLGQGSIWLSVTNMNSQPIQLLSLFDPTQPLGKKYAGPAALLQWLSIIRHTHTDYVCTCIYIYIYSEYIYIYSDYIYI